MPFQAHLMGLNNNYNKPGFGHRPVGHCFRKKLQIQ